MEKHAFRMRLKPGQGAEYRRRHDAIWPELAALLREVGISDYSIHLDEATGDLFAVLWRRGDHRMESLPEQDVMRRWWAWMGEIMETNPDGSPQVKILEPVFHLP